MKPENVAFWSRTAKYLVLALLLAVTLKIVFDCFSYYISRRSLDAELDTGSKKSLEYLITLSRRERALVVDSLESRCRERNQLALYHLKQGGLATLDDVGRKAYAAAFEIKQTLAASIVKNADILKSSADSQAQLSKPGFDLSDEAAIAKLFEPKAGADQSRSDKLVSEAKFAAATIKDVFKDNQAALAAIPLDLGYITTDSIAVLEKRVERLTKEREENARKIKDYDELLSKYAAWTSALSGKGDNIVLDEMDYDLKRDSSTVLKNVLCENLEISYSLLTGRFVDVDASSLIAGPFVAARTLYQEELVSYFSIPPVAQTMFVTLFLGALGALVLHVLKLSKIGWWGTQPDPLWGELVIRPAILTPRIASPEDVTFA